MYTKILLIIAGLAVVFICGSRQLSLMARTVMQGATDNGSDTAVNPDPLVVTACVADTGIDKIICLSNAFKAQLTPDQITKVQLSYSTNDAKKWSNFPPSFLHGNEAHVGLSFGAMTKIQIQYAKALLLAASSNAANEGWDELQQIINSDQYLAASGGGSDYGAANYLITFLGTPSKTGMFELQYGGHHAAFSNTYKNGVLVGATPSFRGVEPFATFKWHGKNNQSLQQEQAALSAMIMGLSPEQQASAKLTKTFGDLLVGPHQDGQFPKTPSGVKCSAFSAAQKQLVMAAINTYVGDLSTTDAAPILKKYASELNDTYVSYAGTKGLLTRDDYVRIDGPSVWIEYSCQGGIVLSPTHPHSVWRDKKTDYGGN